MNISILGLGAMGSRMAARAVACGHRVVTYNRSARTVDGARAEVSPRRAAEASDLVLTMLTDDDAVRQVWLDPDNGAIGGLRPGALAVDMSTVTPGCAVQLAAAVERAGGHFVAAPVVGTLPHAEKGGLTILAGGSGERVALASPALSSFGRVVHVGSVQAAVATKLAINAMFAGQVALLSEALGLMSAAHIDQDRALTLLQGTPVFAPVLTGIAALLRAGDDDPRFPVDLVAKDLRYAADQGQFPLLRAVQERYEHASERGLGGRNIHAV